MRLINETHRKFREALEELFYRLVLVWLLLRLWVNETQSKSREALEELFFRLVFVVLQLCLRRA